MKLTEAQIACLRQADRTFGYREADNRPVFQSLKSMGLVYETVRAFYSTDLGRAALQQQEGRE